MGASAATSYFAQVFKGVDNAADAAKLIDVVLTDPQKLLTGVDGLTGEYYRHIGAPRFGPALVAGADAQQVYTLAPVVAPKLRDMASLANPAEFNLAEFIAEIDQIFYRANRQVRGLTALDEMPVGAVKTTVTPVAAASATGPVATRPAAAGTAGQFVVTFLDKENRPLATSLPMSQQAADEYAKAVRSAVEAGKSDPLNQIVTKSVGIQRALLADMWLNLRPGHWIRNAAAAMTGMMAENLQTFDSMTDIGQAVGKKFAANAPTERVGSAFSGKGRGLTAGDMTGAYEDRHWARNLTKGHPTWDKANLYAAANEAGQKMWTGMTHVLGTNIPFGEQAFYTRAWYKGFQRAFASAWDDVVYQQFGARLREMQIPKPLRDSILNRLRSAGVNGSKADVAKAAREAIMGASMVFDMRSLNIADDTITPQGWGELDQVLQAYARGDRYQEGLQGEQRAIQDIKRIIAAEKTRYQDMLRANGNVDAPAVAERVESTAEEMAQRAGDIVDDLTHAGISAGIPEDQAKTIAQQKAQQVIGAEAEGWDRVIRELAPPGSAGSPTNAAADTGGMIVATDLMAELYDLRRLAQNEVDQLSRNANAASPATRKSAWNIKWFRTQEIYDQLALDQQAAFDNALTRLRQMAAGEPVAPEYDWWKAINRYTDWDDEKLAEARALEVGSTRTTPPEVWDKVIGANRQYLDSSYVMLYAAFRKFPDLDGLDIIRSTQHDIDRIGAQVAAELKPKRDRLWALTETKKVKPGQWDAYFALRNRLWNQAFDKQYRANLGATQAIVANGLAKDVPSKLRWTEDFPGHTVNGVWQPDEYMVMALRPDGLWNVLDVQENKIIQLAGEGAPTLPRLRALLLEWMTPTPNAKGRGPIQPLDQGIGVQVGRLLDAQAAGQPLPDDLPPAVVDAYRELIARAEGEQAWSVPQNVMDDFYRVTDTYHRQLAQTMQEFQARYGQAPQTTAGDLIARAGYQGREDLPEAAQAAAAELDQIEARRAYLDAALQQAEQAPVTPASVVAPVTPPTPAVPAAGDLSQAEIDRFRNLADQPGVDPNTPLRSRYTIRPKGQPQQPSPAPAFASAPSAETFRPLMQRAFNLTDQQAGDVERLAAARANVWAKQTGRDANEWYGAHFADIVQGGDAGPEALLQ
ncbi:MAG: hypothetical protein KAX65_11170, partial [Caldilineaceae bacterium]|nr:hypothetical protein [Caldilineaceae bacterium]